MNFPFVECVQTGFQQYRVAFGGDAPMSQQTPWGLSLIVFGKLFWERGFTVAAPTPDQVGAAAAEILRREPNPRWVDGTLPGRKSWWSHAVLEASRIQQSRN